MIFILFAVSLFQAVTPQSECPHGWTRRDSSCYLFVTHVANDWTESEFFCRLLHSNLAEIETQEEGTFLQSQARIHTHENRDSHGFWIGGTDAVEEGKWIWITSGHSFTYSHWAPGFPDDYHGNEDCLELFKDERFLWNDEKCDHRMSFICELSLVESAGSLVIGK
uniref:C-type lectin domain-containing protein n=2 Tax=Magallana gigas TaxID=29159 RepID=A0A8W8N0W8_MAGGI|nr:perlucin [Crassostrea gigas]